MQLQRHTRLALRFTRQPVHGDHGVVGAGLAHLTYEVSRAG